ncbi:MAG TPA: DNA translocase FtsK 4TM domain-containing protein, partial [Acidobacteriaceae bacterium]|nr:DNA translocase FtsK 4TM domain-containing protein [Acidobacteriaceae bacterium]
MSTLLWDNRPSSEGSGPRRIHALMVSAATRGGRTRTTHRAAMKPLRLVSTPTRNRRLNEILGFVVLVCATLLLLALASYTPTDPSANTVGGYVALPRTAQHLAGRLGARNWTGLAGAWLADMILQAIGIAAFFLPVVIGRIGLCWMRQRPAGSAKAR